MVAMTVQPRDANSFAEARPSPEEVPVMKIVPGCLAGHNVIPPSTGITAPVT